MAVETLYIILGDQLDPESPVMRKINRGNDMAWMCESEEESTRVWSHKVRIAFFLSAMRHYGEYLREKGVPLNYRKLGEPGSSGSIGEGLKRAIREHRPESVAVVEPGEFGIRETIQAACSAERVPLEIIDDTHFICPPLEFKDLSSKYKKMTNELFYRHMRKREGILMDRGKPAGGKWNYDAMNRRSLPKKDDATLPELRTFTPDAVTKEVISLVNNTFSGHPGSLEDFDWPVTPDDAIAALDDFIKYRLEGFGDFQDALKSGEPYLYHSRLSASLNCKLINPARVIRAAEDAYRMGNAPLNSVEGFIRQVLGWREFVRGIYWSHMPEYGGMNYFSHEEQLPPFFWTGDTDMFCLREAITMTLRHGYAHHIQRLMVTGLFCLLFGVDPIEVHRWYLAVYLDAVEWVELPNTLGMSQYADGGLMATKPYIATGKYIKRMSDFCGKCRYNPDDYRNEDSCPFTVMYWDFLLGKRPLLEQNPRMALQVKNCDRFDESTAQEIHLKAERIRSEVRGKGR